ncbi:hypothetical protein PHISCL_06257 [Aspergillus sclerotialis]|uniref:Uncharacterized protein n=1 Tax=Aspergillus sclerotialis TaxID=2070753 RepID=A0A3A2ZJ00_9EURO|nr:hypothetical protein PHISCL_06257 [Aspergillus sclerotialis]
MASTSTDSTPEYPDSPISQQTPAFPSVPRRRVAKFRRFYSSPLNDSSESTPLDVYGLEQREPSIMEKRRNRLQRVSYALDDIKEDFSVQLNPRTTAEKLKRRTSTFIQDSSRPSTPVSSEPSRSRPMSIFSVNDWSPPRRLSRRLSSFSSFSMRRGSRNQASISQPNLIGSSTQY